MTCYTMILFYVMLCNAALYWMHTPSSILTSLSLSSYQMGCCLHVTVRVPSETAPTLYVRSSPPAVSPSPPQQQLPSAHSCPVSCYQMNDSQAHCVLEHR